MSESPPNPSSSQHNVQDQSQASISSSSRVPSQTPAPNSDHDQLQAQNDQLNAQASVLLHEFLAKTRRLVASELDNDMNCTICSEPFLRGDNPEVPVRLDCGHIFGMSCILKWLSPISRAGNNSCPNCRKAVFHDWDKMDYPAHHDDVTTRSARYLIPSSNLPNISYPGSQRPQNTPLAAGSDSTATTRGPEWTFSPLRPVITGTTTSPVITFAEVVTPSPEAEAEETLRQPEQLVFGHQTPEQRAQLLREAETRVREAERLWDEARLHRYNHSGGTSEHARLARPESDRALIDVTRARILLNLARSRETGSQIEPAAQRAAPTPAPADDEEEDNGIATMFNAAEAEYDHQRQQTLTNERKRLMWMQFCEGIVRSIEQSPNSTALTNHDLALTIINMKDLDEFMAERAIGSSTWQRILRTFPRLHTEMVTRFGDFSPLPSINIDNRIELERLLAHTRFNKETLHKARWYTRLSDRLARVAAASEHEDAVDRLTERMANLPGPTRVSTPSRINSSGRHASVEARERRRMEGYLPGRTPMAVRREGATIRNAVRRAAGPA